MRHASYSATIIALAAAFTACTASHLDSPSPEESPRAVVSFAASVPEPDTKISRDGVSGLSSWVEGDRIMIYYDGGSCEAVADNGGSTTTFTTVDEIPTDRGVYCAVYPSSRNATFDGSDVTPDFSQAGEPGTFAYSAICTARVTSVNGTLEFKNTGSMLMFSTSSKKIHEARLYGGETDIYTLIGKNGDETIPYKAGTYYVPMPAGDYPDGFSLRLKNYDGEDYPALYRPEGRTFARGGIYNVGVVEDKVLADGTDGGPTFRYMSFNILRADLEGPDHLWTERKDACLSMIEADAPDIIGLQECTSTQRNDILKAFPRYGAVGVSVNGDKVSAYPKVSSNPILYDSDKFLLEKWGTFWLSDTPDKKSNTWYYDKPRTATWARLKVKGRDLRVVCISMHLQDDSSSLNSEYEGQGETYGPLCRAKEVEVVVGKLAEINPEGYPMVIAGDCNSDGRDSYFNELRETFSLARLDADVRSSVTTFNAFKFWTYAIYDNIFYRGLTASKYAVDRSSYKGVSYVSDHYPVYADLAFSFEDFSANLGSWDVTEF